MKTRLLILFLLIFSFIVPVTSFAQKPINCHFGDESTSLDDIFEKDIAVKTFLKKHPDAVRSIAISPTIHLEGELSFMIDDNDKREILLIKFNQNENGCYRPYAYHYSFNDGVNDVTVKNTISNFTEIVNLIKLDDKKIEDFYTKNCNEIQLDAVLEGDSKPHFCKYDVGNSIEMYLQKHVGGTIEIHIPNKTMNALFYNCDIDGELFVLNNDEEIYYELIADKDKKILKIDAASGYNEIEIIPLGFLNSNGFCGSIWGDDSRYVSPLLQIKIGVEPWMIQCNDDLTLLLKPTEFSIPICVTQSTYYELANRGWAVVLPFTDDYDDENEN